MNPIKKNKTDMLAALSTNLPAVIEPEQPQQVSLKIDDIIADTEEDYNYARDHIKKLISTSDEAIGTLHSLAADSEHPRTFEVLSGLIKTAADMNSQLLNLQRERKKIVCADTVRGSSTPTAISSTTTNNSIFVGTTAELQKLIKNQGMPIIDVP